MQNVNSEKSKFVFYCVGTLRGYLFSTSGSLRLHLTSTKELPLLRGIVPTKFFKAVTSTSEAKGELKNNRRVEVPLFSLVLQTIVLNVVKSWNRKRIC